MIDKILESKTLAYVVVIVLLSAMMLPVYWTLVTAFKPDMETYVFLRSIFLKIPPLNRLSCCFKIIPSDTILEIH